MRQLVAIVGIIVISVGLMVWLGGSKPEAARGAKIEAQHIEVNAQKVTVGEYQVHVRSFGTVEPRDQYAIHALVGGVVLEKSASFNNGALTNYDAVLFEIDPTDYELAYSNALAEYAAAKLALADEQARAKQAASDWAKRQSSTQSKDYVLRQPHLEAAKARLNASSERLRAAKIDLDRTKVKAGFTGLISSADVHVGSVVSKGAVVGHGFATGFGEVRLPVNATDLSLLTGPHTAQKQVSVSILNPLTQSLDVWPAQLVRVEASLNKDTQQVVLVAEISKPFTTTDDHLALIPGQFVNADLHGQVIGDVVTIPSTAVYENEYVYVAIGENQDVLERRPIDVLYSDDSTTVVKNGLTEGELLITTALGQITTGSKIKVVE